MSYLSYVEYQEYGGLLNETAFSSYLYDVESKLNYLTNNRIKELADIPEAVKRLEYKLIGMYEQLNGGSGNTSLMLQPLSSYSNGIESFSYAIDSSNSSKGSTNYDARINCVVQEYLSEYPELLYRGRRQWKQKL